MTGPNTPKVSKLLARAHWAKVGSLLMMSAAVTSLTQVYPKMYSLASSSATLLQRLPMTMPSSPS
jgi:hypothetical protein